MILLSRFPASSHEARDRTPWETGREADRLAKRQVLVGGGTPAHLPEFPHPDFLMLIEKRDTLQQVVSLFSLAQGKADSTTLLANALFVLFLQYYPYFHFVTLTYRRRPDQLFVLMSRERKRFWVEVAPARTSSSPLLVPLFASSAC